MGKRGFDDLQTPAGLNLVMLALTVTFVAVLVGSVIFKIFMDRDRRERASRRAKGERETPN